jgi:hypothetical protein
MNSKYIGFVLSCVGCMLLSLIFLGQFDYLFQRAALSQQHVAPSGRSWELAGTVEPGGCFIAPQVRTYVLVCMTGTTSEEALFNVISFHQFQAAVTPNRLPYDSATLGMLFTKNADGSLLLWASDARDAGTMSLSYLSGNDFYFLAFALALIVCGVLVFLL